MEFIREDTELADITPQLSPPPSESARKALATLLQHLASVGQRHVGEALGVSESKISRLKSEGDLEFFARLVAALGLKLVPDDHQVFDPAKLTALMTLADDGLRSLRASVKGKGE